MLKQFAVGMRVSKFGQHVESEHHNAGTVDAEWQEQMDELTRAELRVRILGGKLGSMYEDKADDLIGEMLDAITDPDISEAEWDALTSPHV